MSSKSNRNTTTNLMREHTGSDWYADTGTFKPSLPQVADCAEKDRPKFKNNKELTAFIRAKLAKQGYRG